MKPDANVLLFQVRDAPVPVTIRLVKELVVRNINLWRVPGTINHIYLNLRPPDLGKCFCHYLYQLFTFKT